MFASRRRSRRFVPAFDGLSLRLAPSGGPVSGCVSLSPAPTNGAPTTCDFSPTDPVVLTMSPTQQTTCGQ